MPNTKCAHKINNILICKFYLGKIKICDWSNVIETEEAAGGKKLPPILLWIWCLLFWSSLTVICTMVLLPKNFESTTTPELGLSSGDFSKFSLIASGLIIYNLWIKNICFTK